MTTNAELQKLREAALPRGVASLLPVYTDRASNAEIWDVEGRRFVDFAAGIAVLNTGHLHPAVKAAVAAQLERFSHTCFQVTQYESYVRLADRLNRLAPGPTPKKSIFFTTGAEAVENAVKIARAHTRRSAVIAFSGAFHGRTMFAIEHAGVEPDLMTVAKCLAGGFPLSGVVGKAEIMDAPAPGGLGGTYAGSPLSCAAALAVLDVIEKENLCARANTIGAVIKQRLNGLRGRHGLSCVGDVRGLGAMVALELVKFGDVNAPDADLTKALVQRAAANGLVLLSCGTRANVIRFLVPLTASDAVISEGLGIFERSLVEVAGAGAEAKRA